MDLRSSRDSDTHTLRGMGEADSSVQDHAHDLTNFDLISSGFNTGIYLGRLSSVALVVH